jgi:Cof subfamily protein (haloacid dehalogenase superfamily)
LVRLLAIDIDGTLLDSKGRVPPANLDAIHRAAARGVRVVIATGRSFHFALQALGGLPDDLTLLVYNGAIARARSGETLLRRLLPQALAREVLAATVEWRSDTACVFDRPLAGQLVYDRMDWSHPNRSGFKRRNAAIIQAVDRLEDAVTEDPVQVTFNGGVAAMRAVSSQLAGLPIAPHLEVMLTEYPTRDFSLVDVCGAGTTKGSGLAAVAGAFGIAQSEVMAVGDNHNDREMLEWAGIGVVMGNAEPELKQPGLHVTGTNDDAGLSQAIDRFVP